jgi:hypothetical protein
LRRLNKGPQIISQHLLRPALSAALAYFILVFAAGFIMGTVRVFLIAPHLGAIGAVLAELPVMLAVSWFVCGWTLRRFRVPARWSVRFVMGAAAFVLLMAAELLVSLFVFGLSISQHFTTYESLAGITGLSAQLAFAVFPLVQLPAGLMDIKPVPFRWPMIYQSW